MRRLDPETIATVQAVIRDSLEFAMQDPDCALPTMRQHAQEFDDDVLMKHVELYVNQWTVDLGDTGQRALDELSSRASQIGIVGEASSRLEVFG